MPTPGLNAFEKNIDRAEALIRIFERGRKRGRPRTEDTQLTRSSLVFSIGALDAYLHDQVLEVVGQFVPQSEDLDKALKAMAPHDLVQSMARAEDHAEVRKRFRAKLDEHFDDASFMGVHGLFRAIRLMGCASRLEEEQLKAVTGRPALLRDLGRYTEERHRIIHRGENVRVKKEKAKDCAELVRALASEIDQEVMRTWINERPF
jgi:hypothetical protein